MKSSTTGEDETCEDDIYEGEIGADTEELEADNGMLDGRRNSLFRAEQGI
jgi:hypothetical protein